MTYIATFHTHFASVNFARELKKSDMKPQLMPVPRKLSSSCGTCVRFDYDGDILSFAAEMEQDDLDTVYLVENDEYLPKYQPAE